MGGSLGPPKSDYVICARPLIDDDELEILDNIDTVDSVENTDHVDNIFKIMSTWSVLSTLSIILHCLGTLKHIR